MNMTQGNDTILSQRGRFFLAPFLPNCYKNSDLQNGSLFLILKKEPNRTVPFGSLAALQKRCRFFAAVLQRRFLAERPPPLYLCCRTDGKGSDPNPSLKQQEYEKSGNHHHFASVCKRNICPQGKECKGR